MKIHEEGNRNCKKSKTKKQLEEHLELIRKLGQQTQISAQVLQ